MVSCIHAYHVFPSSYKSYCNNFLHVCLLNETVSSEIIKTLYCQNITVSWFLHEASLKMLRNWRFVPWLMNPVTKHIWIMTALNLLWSGGNYPIDSDWRMLTVGYAFILSLVHCCLSQCFLADMKEADLLHHTLSSKMFSLAVG